MGNFLTNLFNAKPTRCNSRDGDLLQQDRPHELRPGYVCLKCEGDISSWLACRYDPILAKHVGSKGSRSYILNEDHKVISRGYHHFFYKDDVLWGGLRSDRRTCRNK